MLRTIVVAKKPASKKPASKKPASKKPASKKPASKKPAAPAAPAAKKPAAKKPAAKKPAAKKPAAPAAKKPASKKPASKKPASKKPAPKKPAAKKPAAKKLATGGTAKKGKKAKKKWAAVLAAERKARREYNKLWANSITVKMPDLEAFEKDYNAGQIEKWMPKQDLNLRPTDFAGWTGPEAKLHDAQAWAQDMSPNQRKTYLTLLGPVRKALEASSIAVPVVPMFEDTEETNWSEDVAPQIKLDYIRQMNPRPAGSLSILLYFVRGPKGIRLHRKIEISFTLPLATAREVAKMMTYVFGDHRFEWRGKVMYAMFLKL